MICPMYSFGRQDRGLDVGLADLGDARRVGHVGRVVDRDHGPVGQRDLELHRRHRRHQLEVVLALQPLADDVHVQQAEEAAAEAEPERVGGLRLPGQRRVVERQLLERVAQLGIVVVVHREQAAEDHRLDVAVARQRLGRLVVLGRQRVADGQLRDVLDPRDQVAHLARRERLRGQLLRGEEADVVDLGLRARLHADDRLALAERAVDDADVGDHAAVLVVLGVEDQRARRRDRVARRRRHALDDLLQQLVDALAGLGRDPADRLRRLADQLGDLPRHALGLGARQVDLVHGRDQLEPGVDRQVGVGHRLRLDALGGVDHEQRALARCQRARDLVREVHVPGRVDQVQLVDLAVGGGVEDPHRLGLDRDAALALEVHRVEQLGPHRARVHGVGELEDPIGQRRLAMVDVGDDREVPDVLLVGQSTLRLRATPQPRGKQVDNLPCFRDSEA